MKNVEKQSPGNLNTRLPNSSSCHRMCPASGRSDVIKYGKVSGGKALAPASSFDCWPGGVKSCINLLQHVPYIFHFGEVPSYAQWDRMAPGASDASRDGNPLFGKKNSPNLVSHSIQPAWTRNPSWVEFAHISHVVVSIPPVTKAMQSGVM